MGKKVTKKKKTEERDFYNGRNDQDYVSKTFQKKDFISENNKKAVTAFIRMCRTEGLSKPRIRKYYSNFATILRLAPKGFDLKKADKKDLGNLVINIQDSKYADWSKTDMKVAIKKFYKILNGGEYPDKVKFISTAMKNYKMKLPESLLSREDIKKLISVCQNERDRALISVLYEGGLRAGELGSLKIKHVEFAKENIRLTIPKGKTGPRVIPIIESERYLENWINAHPGSKNPENPLWIKLEQNEGMVQSMTYDNIRLMIKKKAKKAAIPLSKTNLHNFRHSRATELAKKLKEAQLCLYFGWIIGSNQTRTYVHLSMRDLEKSMKEIAGVEEKKEEKPEKKICPRCKIENPKERDFCFDCGMALDLGSAVSLLDKVNDLEENQADVTALLNTLLKNPKVLEDIKGDGEVEAIAKKFIS